MIAAFKPPIDPGEDSPSPGRSLETLRPSRRCQHVSEPGLRIVELCRHDQGRNGGSSMARARSQLRASNYSKFLGQVLHGSARTKSRNTIEQTPENKSRSAQRGSERRSSACSGSDPGERPLQALCEPL